MIWWMMNGMGPRGPHGHRGFDRGFGPRYTRRPMGFHFGTGLGVLFLLPALLIGALAMLVALFFFWLYLPGLGSPSPLTGPEWMFVGGWIILAVIGGLIGAVFMILGSVFGGLATAAEAVFSGLSSTGGIALGAVIGFLLYRRLKRKNAEKASEAEEAADETNESDSYFTSVNSWKNGNS